LPFDGPRRAIRGRAGRWFQSLDAETLTRLRVLAAAEDVTLNTVLVTGLLSLLHHVTGEGDLVIGTAATHRTEGAFGGVIGYLLAPLALRVDVSDDPSIRALLRRVADTVKDALQHLECPFPVVVERLRPVRRPGSSPLFDVMFSLDRAQRREVSDVAHLVAGRPGLRTQLGGMLVESVAVERRSAQFDLTLIAFETPKALSCAWEYDAGLFTQSTIMGLAARWEQVLRAMAGDPHETLSGTVPIGT
jgi:non-ribosomal peptide synthetase component F